MKRLATTEPGEDVMFVDVRYRKKAKTIFIVLGVVIFLLFVLCVVFVVLFAAGKRKPQEEAPQETPQRKICDSKKCLCAAVGKFVIQLFMCHLSRFHHNFISFKISMDIKGIVSMFYLGCNCGMAC